MSDKFYEKAISYEYLIRNAFGCPRGMKNGADSCFMKNAMTMEDGKTYAKHLGSFEKQFKVVTTYLEKALVKLTITKPYDTAAPFFGLQLAKLGQANSTSQLMAIVEDALAKVLELKKS